MDKYTILLPVNFYKYHVGADVPAVTAEIYVRIIAVHVKKTVIRAYLFMGRIK